MTKVEFLKQCTTFFSRKKFSCRNNHYYKEVSRDVLIVFGIQMSRYGGYCYLEYGYCFKSINKYLPYPKFNQLNLNCGRIMTDIGQAIVFERLDENVMGALEKTIDALVDQLINLANLGRNEISKYYLSEASNKSWYILGEETANYFDLPKEVFQYHFVKE